MSIRERRKKKKLTVEKLAELAGVSSALISLIENGKYPVTARTAKKLAPVLGVQWPKLVTQE